MIRFDMAPAWHWGLVVAVLVAVVVLPMLFPVMVLPVSVISTAASASPCTTLASVAPHENSTSALTPRSAKWRRVNPTSSVAILPPSRSSTLVIPESWGTIRTHRATRSEALE